LTEKLLAEERAKPFGTVINRLEVMKPTVRQFVAEVQVLEVSRNALQKLGISWGTTQVTGTGGTTGGVQTKIFTVTPGQAVFGEETVEQPVGRVSPIGAQINALIQSGQARLLANPQQKTIEGADATFLVGGLIPIPVFGFFGVGAGAAAPGAATVVFFPFGITLTLHPEATSGGEIFLQMRVEVTAPDYGLATQVLGTTVPGFRFRGLDDVKLLLKSGDTVVISGLIQDELREQISRFPLLSKIPILGELFKSREFVRQQTELVIAVTIHMEEIPVTEEALRLMQTYQKRPVLPRPSFGLPTGTFPSAGGFGASPVGTSIGSTTQPTSTQQ
jgi:pilus assembly protein CpaC